MIWARGTSNLDGSCHRLFSGNCSVPNIKDDARKQTLRDHQLADVTAVVQQGYFGLVLKFHEAVIQGLTPYVFSLEGKLPIFDLQTVYLNF